MKFGPTPTAQAQGAILAHSLPLAKGRMRKGKLLLAEDILALIAAGHDTVTVAQLEAGDVGEDTAALRVATALIGGDAQTARGAGLVLGPASTGRVNITASGAGLLGLDVAAIAAANRVAPMITLATLPPLARLGAGGMAATIKVISYGVTETDLAQVEQIARGAMRLHPPQMKTAALIETTIGDAPPQAGAQAVTERLSRLDVTLAAHHLVPHSTDAIARALGESRADVALILTASATSDVRDTAPEGLARAGGRMIRFGMPVDPGNLLFLGALGAMPVIGLPGCARSPALNGADWVLERVICGQPVGGDDIAAMGVGGLLKDILQRGRKRSG